MIRAIIIDDEVQCISALQYDLNYFCPEVNIVASCTTAEEGLRTIRVHQPQLVFLDVQMPTLNGFEVLQQMPSPLPFQVIFTTAYERFATAAFRVNATDYLLKPVDSQDLIEAVSRVKKALYPSVLGTDSFKTEIPAIHQDFQKIAFPNRTGYDLIDPEDIIYCEADGSYTNIVLAGNKQILFSKPLGTVHEMLDGSAFDRIHHSYLINLKKITEVKKRGTVVVMSNGAEISLARSKKVSFLKKLRP